MSAVVDRVGERFDHLLVLRRVPSDNWKAMWLCRCDCGIELAVQSNNLQSGNSKSCGCQKGPRIARARTKHGEGGKGNTSREYRVWRNMISRCENPNVTRYKDWGGRGIKVCDRWRKSFEAFLEDMGRCPPAMSIDRYPNNNGNYEPGNCRWATSKEQRANQRPKRTSENVRTNSCE